MNRSLRPSARPTRPRALRPLACVLASLGGLAGLASACSDPVGLVERITELPRSLTMAEVEVIDRSNAFGFALARQLGDGDDRPNVVISPLSASMALGMTLNGAAGSTFDAMRGALGFDGLQQDAINASYRGLLDVLDGLDPSVEVSIGNAIWANRDIDFLPSFFATVGPAFDAAVETSDFGDPATLRAINDWASAETRGRIPKILDELDPELAMLLLNAIWFDGRWRASFDPDDTRPAPFQLPDGSSVEVDMMTTSRGRFGLHHSAEWAAAELYYGGAAWSMVVAMPAEGSARQMFADLDGGTWQRIVDGMSEVEIDQLSLPKFLLEYDVFLNEALEALGMGEAFRPGADFTRLSPPQTAICLDFVRQKTFIEVDEVGTRAGAVTAVGARPVSFNGLIVDRPFVFGIRERLTGTILFLGLVEDPTFRGAPAESIVSTCG